MSDGDNDYEMQRLERIRQNKAKLQELGLPGLMAALQRPNPPKPK